jgi:hypothetical protein
MTPSANQEGEDPGCMTKECVIGILHPELQPEVLKTVNVKRNAVDLKILQVRTILTVNYITSFWSFVIIYYF